MKGSGVEHLCETVYAPKSMEHSLTGHAYAVQRGNTFSDDFTDDSDVRCSRFLKCTSFTWHPQIILESICNTSSVHEDDDLQKLSDALETITKKTYWKKWINYLILTHILRIFIYAARTGQWDLHLYAIINMIPIFYAAGYLAYARCAGLLKPCADSQKSWILTSIKNLSLMASSL